MNSITESEAAILNLLWENKCMSIMQIAQALEEDKHWSKHAVISFLKRMEAKGTVTYRMTGRTKLYSAAAEKEEMIVKETRGFLNKFFDGSFGVMASYFLNSSNLTDEEMDELKSLLDGFREKENE